MIGSLPKITTQKNCTIGEENYPENDDELKKNVADVAKVDRQEAGRVFHPKPN